jgi:LacI family transcriptional regulator
MVCSTAESKDAERHYLRLLEEHRVDGVLITPVARDLGRVAALPEHGIPTVLLDRKGPQEVPEVVMGRRAPCPWRATHVPLK